MDELERYNNDWRGRREHPTVKDTSAWSANWGCECMFSCANCLTEHSHILGVHTVSHHTQYLYTYTQNHKYTGRVVQCFLNGFNYPWKYIKIYMMTWGSRGGGRWVNFLVLVKPVSWGCCLNHYPAQEDRDSTIRGILVWTGLVTQSKSFWGKDVVQFSEEENMILSCTKHFLKTPDQGI